MKGELVMWKNIGKFVVATVLPAVAEICVKEILKKWKNKHK